jgi:hypothetical protein
MKSVSKTSRILTFVLFTSLVFSACSDQDGIPVDQALNSQEICDTTTQSFDVSVVGLGNLSCVQTSLKDSTLIGLLLLSGLNVTPNDTAALSTCPGSLLLDIACNDPSNALVFHEKCTIEDPKPICTTDVSPNEILLNAISNALGVSAGSISNTTIQDALNACGVASGATLLSLSDTEIQCVLDHIRAALTST